MPRKQPKLFVILRTIRAAAALTVLFFSDATLADDAGKRDFPATLVVEEPQVESEITPAIAHGNNSDNVRQTDFSSELSVQLAAPFAVVIHPAFTVLRPGGNGFQNLDTLLKYQFIADPEHEFVVSAGLGNEWGGTGSRRVGADPFSAVTPTVFLGKGLGDLPDGWDWARPIAMTGQAGFEIPTKAKSLLIDPFGNDPASPNPLQPNPYMLNLAGSFQYSLPYAFENVPGLKVPSIIAELVPIVEYSLEIPVANNGAHIGTTGTIDPGFLWCRDNLQIGLEALIPINRDSGRHPGVRLQLAYSFSPPWMKHAEADGEKKKD